MHGVAFSVLESKVALIARICRQSINNGDVNDHLRFGSMQSNMYRILLNMQTYSIDTLLRMNEHVCDEGFNYQIQDVDVQIVDL